MDTSGEEEEQHQPNAPIVSCWLACEWLHRQHPWGFINKSCPSCYGGAARPRPLSPSCNLTQTKQKLRSDEMIGFYTILDSTDSTGVTKHTHTHKTCISVSTLAHKKGQKRQVKRSTRGGYKPRSFRRLSHRSRMLSEITVHALALMRDVYLISPHTPSISSPNQSLTFFALQTLLLLGQSFIQTKTPLVFSWLFTTGISFIVTISFPNPDLHYIFTGEYYNFSSVKKSLNESWIYLSKSDLIHQCDDSTLSVPVNMHL